MTRHLYINSRDELLRIDISKIVYFEADGNYTNIILANKLKGTVNMNLGQMQKLLTESLREEASVFARIGKRHIINLQHVYLINVLKQRMVLSDGQNFAFQIEVSKDALRKIKDLIVSRGAVS